MVSVSIVRSVRRFVSFLHSPFDIPVAISCRGKLPLVELDVVASLVPMTPMISTEGERERAGRAVSPALGSQIILHAPQKRLIENKKTVPIKGHILLTLFTVNPNIGTAISRYRQGE